MKNKAFTFIELAIVITLLVASLALVGLYSQVSQVRADVNTQAASFVAYARLASSDEEAGRSALNHGIHLEPDSYILFEGASYVPEASENFTISLPATISIQNIALNGAGSDIIFNAPNGGTNTYGSFDFHSEQINKTVSITIDENGKISY